jgi:hypothetical protein
MKFILVWTLCVLSTLSLHAGDLPNTGVYPYVPISTEDINKKIKFFAEDEDPIVNVFEIYKKGLSKAKTTEKPWTSTYWPLNKGLIADPYKTDIQYHRPMTELRWQKNYKEFLKRKRNVHTKIDELTQEELDVMAPSEKYDLLLGDDSFHLTNRLWDYAYRWGSKKDFGFLSSINILGGDAYALAQSYVDNGEFDSLEAALNKAIEVKGGLTESIAQDLVNQGAYPGLVEAMSEAEKIASDEVSKYKLTKKSNNMALWEGICHGWATAAGIVPRPRKTVKIDMGNGKQLRFFPDDLKGLASLLWANSLVQDSKFLDPNTGENVGGGVIWEGLRCNLKRPKRDRYGRTYDHRAGPVLT